MKRQANSCFINNCFDLVLKAWQENMDNIWHICVNVSQKLKISVHQLWKRQPEKSLKTTFIFMTPWKQLLKLTQAIESVLFSKQFAILCQNWRSVESFPLCFLLTQIFQRKEFKYYFLKNSIVNYQKIAQIFSRKQI